MKVLARDIKDASFACQALILPIPEGEGVRSCREINRAMGGMIAKVISAGEFKGSRNELCLLHSAGRIKPERVLLVGLGKRKGISAEQVRQAGGKAVSYLRGINIVDIAVSAGVLSSLKVSPADLVEGCLLANYRFARYKRKEPAGIKKLTVLTAGKIQGQLRQAEITAAAAHLARDLVNTPSNDMTPSSLLKFARSLKKTSVKVIDRAGAAKLGMGAYLSVARGSSEPPKFIVITYKGSKKPPVVLIGKSITFDSGGISLKPSEGMEKMKYDMAGGAAVLGALKAASELRMPVHIIGILPATENLPGGTASKPGDVVRTISGRTIEIISTDAEGRLVVADAIDYAKRFKPSAVIDIATLTGACSITFGNEAIAMMGNNEALMKKMGQASEETYERVWQMPLYEEYRDYIKSDVADIKNSSGRSGSLMTSATFLSEFAGDTPWVHLDIAGTAWSDKDRPYTPKGATGIGVRLLLNFLRKVSG